MRKTRKGVGFWISIVATAVFIYIVRAVIILRRERVKREEKREEMGGGVKITEATVSTFESVFDKFKSEAPNNKANLILFLADIDPQTSLSCAPGATLVRKFMRSRNDRFPMGQKLASPDCVRAEPVIYRKVEASSGDVGLLRAYVGDRPTWRNPRHPWRVDSRFKLTGVPTLIRWENESIKGRLEDHEAHDGNKIDALLA